MNNIEDFKATKGDYYDGYPLHFVAFELDGKVYESYQHSQIKFQFPVKHYMYIAGSPALIFMIDSVARTWLYNFESKRLYMCLDPKKIITNEEIINKINEEVKILKDMM